MCGPEALCEPRESSPHPCHRPLGLKFTQGQTAPSGGAISSGTTGPVASAWGVCGSQEPETHTGLGQSWTGLGQGLVRAGAAPSETLELALRHGSTFCLLFRAVPTTQPPGPYAPCSGAAHLCHAGL